MRALLLLAGAVGCSAQAAPATQMKLVADVKAWGIEAAAGKLVVIDDGMLSVTAIDAKTGAKAWTTTLQARPARGTHDLVIDRTNVLAWFGPKAHVLDAATGKLARTYDTIEHANKCGLWVKEGICARVCDCSFALADCTTGALLSTTYNGTYREELDPDGGRSSGCWGFDGWPLGTAGKLALVSVDDPKPHVAGIDPATTREVWRRDMSASPQDYETGHSPDGKTCWFTDRSDGLAVLDCATGKELWATKAAKGTGRHVVQYVPGHGLFEHKAQTVTLHAERTGKVIWTKTVSPDAAAWPKGFAPIADLPRPTGLADARAVVILDPATGAQVAKIAVPKGAEVIPDAGGTFLLAQNKELVAYSAAGVETGRAAVPAYNLELGETLVAMGRNGDVVVVEKPNLREVLRVPGDNLSFVVEGGLGPGRIAIWQYDAKSVGRVRLYATRR